MEFFLSNIPKDFNIEINDGDNDDARSNLSEIYSKDSQDAIGWTDFWGPIYNY